MSLVWHTSNNSYNALLYLKLNNGSIKDLHAEPHTSIQ